MGECEPRNFLQPCLLLLLRERSDHGYDLVTRLRELHIADGDAGAIYRALRGMEHHGLVRSTWQASDAGPARRTYQLTPAGLTELDRQAVLLEATHQTLHVFRGRYQCLRGEGAGPPGGGAGERGERGEGNGHGAHGPGSQNGHGRAGGRGIPPPRRTGERAGR